MADIEEIEKMPPIERSIWYSQMELMKSLSNVVYDDSLCEFPRVCHAKTVCDTIGMKNNTLVALKSIPPSSFICFCPWYMVNGVIGGNDSFAVVLDDSGDNGLRPAINLAKNEGLKPRRCVLAVSNQIHFEPPWCGHLAKFDQAKANCIVSVSTDGILSLWSTKKIRKGAPIVHEGGTSTFRLPNLLESRRIAFHYQWNVLRMLAEFYGYGDMAIDQDYPKSLQILDVTKSQNERQFGVSPL